MRKLKLQLYYMVPDHLRWIAVNQDGTVVGFENAPIRDYNLCVWQDSVTGSYGEMLLYDSWTTFVRRTNTMFNHLNHNIADLIRTKNRSKQARLLREKEEKDGLEKSLLHGGADTGVQPGADMRGDGVAGVEP